MYLGIDLGTSAVKALLIDDDQKIIASCEAGIDVSRPHEGWSEQVPTQWISETTSAFDHLKSEFGPQLSAVKSIGLSGQMHGATLLDEHDDVLRPCMLWNDTRAHTEAAAFDGNPAFHEISGNIVFPGFTAPKVEWVRKNEQETFAKVRKILLPKDYLRLWLTGEYVSEMSDASGTSWLDVGGRRWSEELLGNCDLSVDNMPRLVEGSSASGTLRCKLASSWGMSNSVIVAGGAGDNAASAIGMGATNNNDAFVSLGTSGVLFAATQKFRPAPQSAVHAFCHALPQLWHQMGVILSAGDALNWYAAISGKSAQELSHALGEKIGAPSGITFLPYLSGERTPHNDAAIRGAFVGLAHASDQRMLTQAVLEGVGFALRDNLHALAQAGTELSKVTAVGGGGRSRYWLELIATILNIPVLVPTDGDFGAAFGAARLGMLATGNFTPEEICNGPKIRETIDPVADLVHQYDAAYEIFRATYPTLKEL